MSKLSRLANRRFPHNRDNEGDYGSRMLMHIPAGFFIGLIPFNREFSDHLKFYEDNEDAHTKDEAWKDEAGILVGIVMGRILLVAIVIYVLGRIFL